MSQYTSSLKTKIRINFYIILRRRQHFSGSTSRYRDILYTLSLIHIIQSMSANFRFFSLIRAQHNKSTSNPKTVWLLLILERIRQFSNLKLRRTPVSLRRSLYYDILITIQFTNMHKLLRL